MNYQYWQEHIQKINSSLQHKELKETFDLLKILIREVNDWQSEEMLSETEATYKNMLHYMQDGIKDPARDFIYNELLRSIYRLADTLSLTFQVKSNPGFYFEKKRTKLPSHHEDIRLLIHKLESITGNIALNNLLEDSAQKDAVSHNLLKEKEFIDAKLFKEIWLSDHWFSDEKDIIADLINNKIYSVATQSLLISAVTLNLQMTFDENKLMLLLETAENSEEEIRQRVLTGILLSLRKYDNRIYLYPEINNRLQYLAENNSFTTDVRNIMLHFILSKDTEKITRKITEELLPEMKKINPILNEKIKLEDLMSESGLEDKNPDWKSIIDNPELTSKLQEFSELQMEGADVLHSSFSHLKTYPFFNETGNWFLPFTTSHSIFKSNSEDKNIIRILQSVTNFSFLCNSDKYSLFLSLVQMPQAYRSMLIGQFSAEASALKEMQETALPDHYQKAKETSGQYIRDLYRFYKLHPRKSDFDDIFEIKPEFYQVKSIETLVADNKSLLILGEYYFSRNYFEEAAKIFEKLLSVDPQNDTLYQKIGYCMQMTDQPEKALDAFLKAEFFNSSNTWVIKRIAHCYRLLKNPENAFEYYHKVEKLNPENLSVQLNIGHCHLELKNYQEALKCYFKVEYLDKNGSRAWRPIAWCSFLTGKYSQAQEYFDKILVQDKPDATDYLNAGHVQLAGNNPGTAINFYIQSVKYPGHSMRLFMDAFRNDVSDLIHAGISQQDIPLILDQVRYNTGY